MPSTAWVVIRRTATRPALSTGHSSGPGAAPRTANQSASAVVLPAAGYTTRALCPFPDQTVSAPPTGS